MSYYQGDFYQGDFYQGDPGFFSFLGKAVKGIAGVASSFIPGVGGVVSKAISKIPTGGKQLAMRAGSAMMKHPVLTAAGGAGLIGGSALATRMGTRMGAAGVGPATAMRGFHVSRKTGALVKNRRMRVTNPKALRRAIRRCAGFSHLAKRVLRFTSPRPPRGRAVFKHRRRRKTV